MTKYISAFLHFISYIDIRKFRLDFPLPFVCIGLSKTYVKTFTFLSLLRSLNQLFYSNSLLFLNSFQSYFESLIIHSHFVQIEGIITLVKTLKKSIQLETSSFKLFTMNIASNTSLNDTGHTLPKFFPHPRVQAL